jgi:hypothetical protein
LLVGRASAARTDGTVSWAGFLWRKQKQKLAGPVYVILLGKKCTCKSTVFNYFPNNPLNKIMFHIYFLKQSHIYIICSNVCNF